MGTIHDHQPVKLFVGMLAGEPMWFETAERALVERFGPVDLAGDVWSFTQTDYYASEMGEGLLRKFLAFEQLIAPEAIVEAKHVSNAIEADLARHITDGPARPVNLDPGYVDLAKVVLATTKDFAHRIALGRGIYAEVTLNYRHGEYAPNRWTYPDYQTPEYTRFFLALRERLRDNRRSR